MTLHRNAEHSTNGLARSTHQFIQTIMLTLVLGLGAWCWHLLTNNSDRLIRVEDRQTNVLDRLGRVEINLEDLGKGQVRQDDRIDNLEKGNRNRP